MPRQVGDRYVCEKCGAQLVYEKACPCAAGMSHSEGLLWRTDEARQRRGNAHGKKVDSVAHVAGKTPVTKPFSAPATLKYVNQFVCGASSHACENPSQIPTQNRQSKLRSESGQNTNEII